MGCSASKVANDTASFGPGAPPSAQPQESDEEIRSYFLDLFELIAEDERW